MEYIQINLKIKDKGQKEKITQNKRKLTCSERIPMWSHIGPAGAGQINRDWQIELHAIKLFTSIA